MRYRIVICDDNICFGQQVKLFVQNFCVEHKVEHSIQLYSNSDDVMKTIEQRQIYDLYILDIQMPGYSGLDLVKELQQNNIQSDVILLTAHTNYAIDAYEYTQIFRYIPKESAQQRMRRALDDYFVKMKREEAKIPYLIQNSLKSIRIFQENIIYIYKEKKYAIFVMTSGKEERERIGIDELYHKLDPQNMFLLNRGTIVNIHHISGFRGNEVTMDDNTILSISPEKTLSFKTQFNRYWGDLI